MVSADQEIVSNLIKKVGEEATPGPSEPFPPSDGPFSTLLVNAKRWFVFLLAVIVGYLGFQHAFGGIWISLFPSLQPLYGLVVDTTVLYYFGTAAVLIALERVAKFSIGKDGISAELAEVKHELQENSKKLETVKNDVKEVADTANESNLALVGGVGGKASTESTARFDGALATTKMMTPVLPADANDLRKGQFGSKNNDKGRNLTASVVSAKRGAGNYIVRLRVESVDASNPLSGKVKFYLHDTFSPPIVTVDSLNGVATLERIAYGAFTVGVEIINENIQLELDLAEDTSFPEDFRNN